MPDLLPDPAIHLTVGCAHPQLDTGHIRQLETRIHDQELLIQSLCRQLASTIDLLRHASQPPSRHHTVTTFSGPSFELSDYLAPEIHEVLKAHGLSDVTVHDRTRESDLLPTGSSAFLWQLAIERLRTPTITLCDQKEPS